MQSPGAHEQKRYHVDGPGTRSSGDLTPLENIGSCGTGQNGLLSRKETNQVAGREKKGQIEREKITAITRGEVITDVP